LAKIKEIGIVRPEREILHVDDDPLMTRIVAGRLQPYGYRIVSLNDPTEAINELIHKNRRVVLLDIDMPIVSGRSVGGRLSAGTHRHDPDVPETNATGAAMVLQHDRPRFGALRFRQRRTSTFDLGVVVYLDAV